MHASDERPTLKPQNEAIARQIAACTNRKGADRHEIESRALWAALKAQRSFDPTRGRQEDEWVAINVRLAIRNVKRNYAKSRKCKPLDEDNTPTDRGPTPLDAWAKREDVAEFWREAVRGLPPKQTDAVLAIFRDGLSTEEAAAKLGVAPRAVDLRISRAKSLLRVNLKEHAGNRPSPKPLFAQPKPPRRIRSRRSEPRPGLGSVA